VANVIDSDPLAVIYGTWDMKGDEQAWYQLNATNPTLTYGYNEMITITPDSFILEEFNKTTGNKTDQCVFSISIIVQEGNKDGSDWFALTGNTTTASEIFTGKVYRLTGATTYTGGYTSMRNLTTMYLYMNADETQFVRTVSNNNKVVVGRVYKKN